jgi:hypothetical protein
MRCPHCGEVIETDQLSEWIAVFGIFVMLLSLGGLLVFQFGIWVVWESPEGGFLIWAFVRGLPAILNGTFLIGMVWAVLGCLGLWDEQREIKKRFRERQPDDEGQEETASVD